MWSQMPLFSNAPLVVSTNQCFWQGEFKSAMLQCDCTSFKFSCRNSLWTAHDGKRFSLTVCMGNVGKAPQPIIFTVSHRGLLCQHMLTPEHCSSHLKLFTSSLDLQRSQLGWGHPALNLAFLKCEFPLSATVQSVEQMEFFANFSNFSCEKKQICNSFHCKILHCPKPQ